MILNYLNYLFNNSNNQRVQIDTHNPMIFMDEEREPLINHNNDNDNYYVQMPIAKQVIVEPTIITEQNVQPLLNETEPTSYNNCNTTVEEAFRCIHSGTRYLPIKNIIQNNGLTIDEAKILIELLDDYLLNVAPNKQIFRRKARQMLLNYVYGEEEIVSDIPIINEYNGVRRSRRIINKKNK